MEKIIFLTIFLILPMFFPSSFQEELSEIDSLQKVAIEQINQKNYDESIITLEKILKLEPTNFFALNNKGTILLEQEKYLEAIQTFEIGLTIRNSTELWNNKAIAHINLNEHVAALESFYHSLKIDPSNEVAFNNAKWLAEQLPFVDYTPIAHGILQIWDQNGNLIGSSKSATIAILPGIGIEEIRDKSTIEFVPINGIETEVIKYRHIDVQYLNEYRAGLDLFYEKENLKFKVLEIKFNGLVIKSGDIITYDLILINSLDYFLNR